MIYAIDPGLHTGVAIFREPDYVLVAARELIFDAHGALSAMPSYRLYRWLRNRLSERDIVVYERSYAQGWAAYRLISMETGIAFACLSRDCAYVRLSPSQWKKAALGNGKASPAEYTAHARRKYGDCISTNNIAAAVLIGDAYLSNNGKGTNHGEV